MRHVNKSVIKSKSQSTPIKGHNYAANLPKKITDTNSSLYLVNINARTKNWVKCPFVTSILILRGNETLTSIRDHDSITNWPNGYKFQARSCQY